MYELSSLFAPLVTAARSEEPRTRDMLIQGITSAMSGHRTPPMAFPLPALPSLLRALPRPSRGLATPASEPERVLAFLSDSWDLPMEGETISFPTWSPTGTYLLEGIIDSVMDAEHHGEPGWFVHILVAEDLSL